MSKRRSRKVHHGFTLIECMTALAVLGIGGMATAQLITVLINGAASTGAHTEAMALASRLVAEINDARFVTGAEDAGLVSGGAPAGYRNYPVVASTIQTVGEFTALGEPTSPGQGAYIVSYEVVNCTACANPFADGQVGLGGVEVLVTVQSALNISNSKTPRLLRPLHLLIRKEYSPTGASGAAIRGWS